MPKKLGSGLFASARRWRLNGRRLRSSTSRRAFEDCYRSSSFPRSLEDDVEAPTAASVRRRLQPEAFHGAPPEEEPTCGYSPGYRQLSREMNEAGEIIVAKARTESRADEIQYAAQRIIQRRDAYWEQRRQDQGADFDEEEEMKNYARQALLETTSNADVMQTAELLIEEDWLGKVDALPGNIYRLSIMGDVLVAGTGSWSEDLAVFAKVLGMVVVVLVQVAGPPMIFLSRLLGIGVLYEANYVWQCCPWHPSFQPDLEIKCQYQNTAPKDVTYWDDWHHVLTTKVLGILMMFAFILNGLFVMLDEKQSWKCIYNTFRYLDVMNTKFKMQHMPFFLLDALVNAWVICWCSADVYLVIGASQSPQDVLMNALGLIFLYNLDDVGGDLGFVNEDDWPGERLAWIYQELVQPCDKATFNEDKMDCLGWVVISVYNSALVFILVALFAVPTLAMVTPFIQIIA
eukprot:TRINITY_DN9394_c0_g1_i1.p1 TRINITY_DN9394_c0_g1~~TRINITY_DN9394_c0_g1_i1.p1  ORF type:complete len:459 (+),score=105.65 TRINITY_DN9394_c0_g1_i1:86-1462(+)